ncbi:MAG: transposase [Thermoleophilaceae bacterium]|nr:transposase [Thermoleophilaceae bacterium]
MAMNFISCDRNQVFLMPPLLSEWLPDDHLAWTVLDAVTEMDLGAFYRAYRADGHGRPAYEPSMMVALLLYAYARGNRSSRAIERACVEDVAYRVVAGNLVPDHSTIADFRVRHEAALAELFTGVLGLCRQAGLVSVGVIAIDGTKIQANASREANRGYGQIAREILAEAAETDRREDELYGEARGDELPERLRTSEGRRAALREAKAKLEREAGREARPDSDEREGAGVEIELDPERFVTRSHGRRAWFREARRGLDEQREQEARPIARSRLERLGESARRLEEELAVEHLANAAYEAWRQRGVAADGSRRMAPGTTKPYRPPDLPAGTINTTDPDSRLVKTVGQRALQGYNAQAAVNEHQIVVAAEVTVDSPDFGHLEPMVDATQRELAIIGAESPAVVVADAGYWHKRQMEKVVDRGIQVLIPPDSGLRKSARPGWDGGLYAFMRRVLSTDQAKALYRKRQATVEPVFGQMKFNRGFDRFGRRGRSACRSEWRLFGASHNLLKLHSHRIVAAGA